MKINALIPALAIAGVLASAPAGAADLTVYTYESFISSWGPGPELKKRFEAECACSIAFVGAEDGVSLLNRLKLEGTRTGADVVVGLDDSLMADARAAGVVQPHRVDLAAVPLSPALQWSDDSFVPFDHGYFAFIYDSRKIAAPARSFAELVDGKAKIIYQDPRTSTPGLGLAHWVRAVFGDGAPAAWRKLAANTVTVTSGWQEAYTLFLNGEADYVLSYTTSPAYHVVAENVDHYRAAAFAEGHVAQVEVAAMSAHTRNPQLASRFLAFLVSPAAQEVIPVTNWMLPVRDDVALPPVFATLVKPQRIGFGPGEIAARRADWVKEWRGAVSR